MRRPSPNRERLLEFARQLARELHAIEPPEAELSERIDYVVWGRKQAWTCLEDGIITESELRQLLIDHLDYECAHISGRAWPEFDEAARRRFVDELEQLLFGRPAQE
ncbi:hypothetical protein [Enhygromyxa salina]|uniref:hypothetical protein n=1 Tax=Enhygromyxa salina TaxID=215803 RepID=UPI0011B2299E|nr:hypothetical protein [Enhygromyxa salina]